MKKGAGVCSLNRVPWCWGISKEKPFCVLQWEWTFL